MLSQNSKVATKEGLIGDAPEPACRVGFDSSTVAALESPFRIEFEDFNDLKKCSVFRVQGLVFSIFVSLLIKLGEKVLSGLMLLSATSPTHSGCQRHSTPFPEH